MADPIPSQVYSSLGLTEYEYNLIVELVGRQPSYTELGMFSVMWSEHCGYKYSRPVLKLFSKYKEAMEGKGLENAGVVEIEPGFGVTMKVESHNHPSAVEPYQGAATGVGGIIRDILTMGARPIAGLNSLHFGTIHEGTDKPETVSRNKYLFEHVVAGIGGYGNCVGVPTVAGEIKFHPRYSGNPLVNAMCVGVLDTNKITTAAASGAGNPVVYLGSSTGKDGIQGASFASEALGENSEVKRPNVQIGDPFAGKLLIEATLEALQTGAIVAIQDMGAAGLTCSTVEMAAKGGCGMTINLDLVPMREDDMTAFELMLSESQERMMAVCELGREQEVIDIFHKWDLKAVVIGHVTEEPRLTITRLGVIHCDLNPKLLEGTCPTYETKPEIPAHFEKRTNFSPASLEVEDAQATLLGLLALPDIASKKWVTRQYDSDVQTQTIHGPAAAEAAVLAPRGTSKGIAIKLDGNARYVYGHPKIGGRATVAEACRNIACTGAIPVALTDGLNFGDPQKPHVYWQFSEAVAGIAEAAEAMQTPVISGNVSFYNETEQGEVLPTPLVGVLGVMDSPQDAIPSAPRRPVELLLVSAAPKHMQHEGLGCSSLALLKGVEDGYPEDPDLTLELKLCQFLSQNSSIIECAKDVSDGGLAVALAEMAIGGKCGLSVNLEGDIFESLSSTGRLFGEIPGWVVVGCLPENVSTLTTHAKSAGLTTSTLGSASANANLQISSGNLNVNIPTELLESTFNGSIFDAMAR